MRHFNKLLWVIILAVMVFSASAETFDVGYLTYNITAYDRVEVYGLSYSGSTTANLALEIPGTVTYNGTTYRVYNIRDFAFNGHSDIKSVKIRYGVTIIGQCAFQLNTGLETLYLPSSIDQIDDFAFYNCKNLKTVYYAGFNFPKLGLGATPFPSNSNMTLNISPLSKRTIAEYKAADGWNVFTNVYNAKAASDFFMVDGGYYSMGYSDQWGPTATRSATLVGYNSVSGTNTSNGTVYMPTASVYTVTNNVPFSIDTIGINAFQGQTTLQTIDLTNASNLKYIDIIGPSSAVANVTRLVMPSSNFSFSTSTFENLASVSAFELASGSTKYSIFKGCLYNKAQTTLYRVPCGKSGSMDYPSTYPATLTYLWPCCHARCTGITSAYLPYGVKTISDNAFAGMSNLVDVRIPSSVTNLNSHYVFQNCKPSLIIWCNMDNPPMVEKSTYFGDNSGMKLYIPYGKESVYSAAGWTGFSAVNNNSIQAFDFNVSNLCYTVTSTESTTVNGTTYDGQVKLVCAAWTAGGEHSPYNIPASVTNKNKTYAVTRIGEDAFNNITSNFTVTGCANVDTIGAYAFQNQPITSYPFGHNSSRYIMAHAFDGAGLTGTVALPYGVKYVGSYAFANGKYSRIVVPKGVNSFCDMWCNTSTLTEIVYNNSNHYNYSGWEMTGVPSTCYIRVPTGVVNHYKQNSKLSSRADHITAGAYDFAWSNRYESYYFLTITSTASTTYNGTTYAGKAKYVYHPNIQNYTGTNNYGFSTSEEDRTVSSDYRKYLITELGDSLLYGSGFVGGTIPASVTRIGQSAFMGSAYAVNNLTLPSGLTFIGHDAFYNCKITGELKIPASVTLIESYALSTSTLSSIYFPGAMPTMGSYVWKSSFNGTVWVPNNYAGSYLTTANGWSASYASKLGVWFKPYASSVPFSSVLPTNLWGSNITAYIATAYNKSNPTQQLTMTRVNQAAASTGMILTGLTANQEYRINQPTGTVSAPATNYLVGTPQSTVRVDQQTVGYYWSGSASTPHFIKATSPYSSTVGQAYLKLSSTQASGMDDVYTNLWPKPVVQGDINGDGSVDVSDVNIIINIMLGKADASDYPGNADLNGDNSVDVSDVNIVINIMLGKA